MHWSDRPAPPDSAPSSDAGPSSLAVPLYAALLVLMWFLPELLKAPPVFPFQIIAETEGQARFALLAPPIAGALLLLLFAAKGANRLLRCLTFAVAAGAAVPLSIFAATTIYPSVAGNIAAALITTGVVVAGGTLHHRKALFYPLLLALPLLLEAAAIGRAAVGTTPAEYLGPYKLPVSLFFASAAAAHALSGCFRK